MIAKSCKYFFQYKINNDMYLKCELKFNNLFSVTYYSTHFNLNVQFCHGKPIVMTDI